MAISVSGIGSGLDIDGLVTQLMQVEARPLTTLAQREAGVQAKISAFGTIASAIAGLQTAANGLNSAAKFAATKATPGTNAGFTATSTPAARPGTYSVSVTQLAAAQRVALSQDAFTSASGQIAAGTLNFSFGSADALAADNPDSTASLEFAGGSLADLRKAINDAKLGVTASVVNDGDGDRLVLTGAKTGAAQAFRIDGLGVAFSPDDPGEAGDAVYGLQGAQDAQLTVDGLAVTRPTNSVQNVIEGVTLNLTATGASTLTVTADPSGARSSIEAFVNAYNNAVTTLGNLTRVNTETRQASVLTGDSAARSVQSQLRNLVGGVFGGLGDTQRLSDLGISFQLDGTLAIDNTRLNSALNDPERDVAAFFTGNGDTPGFARRVSDALGNLIGASGLITGRTEGLKTSAQALQRQAEALNNRLESVEKRYRAQFTALDVMIANMSQTSTFLQQQLANLPGLNRN